MSEPSARRASALALIRSSSPYAARWTDDRTCRGDFEGREYSIEFFDVPRAKQKELRRDLRQVRHIAEELLGRPIILIFHTPDATAKHYREIVVALSRIEKAVLDAPLTLRVRGSLSQSFVTVIEPSLRMPLVKAA